MPYKIIQSIERGKSLLVAIPEQWEKDGILYWPRRNSEKLQKNEYSEPEINWSTKNCIVKRNNIPNLHEAEAIIDIMCDNSDTEPEPDMSRRTRLQYTSKKDVQINFNDMAQEFSKNKAIINTDGIIEQSTSYEYLDNQESIIFTQEAVPNVVPAPVTRELEVSVVFHSAASVRFDEELPKAVEQNVLSVKRLLAVCDKLPALQVLMHVSTAFSQAEHATVEEAVYPLQRPLQQLIEHALTQRGLTQEQTRRYIAPKPNTYTYTKMLAESVIQEHSNDNYVRAIFRPSIVISSFRNPFPGWIENLNGPSGAVVAVSKGLLHTFNCKSDAQADLLPVDIAADTLLAAAWDVVTHPGGAAPRVYTGSGGAAPTCWRQLRRRLLQVARAAPPLHAGGYPFFFLLENKFLYKVTSFFLQTLPLHIAEYIYQLFNWSKKKNRVSLITIASRLQSMNAANEYFMTREWRFSGGGVRRLLARLPPADAALYTLDPALIDWKETYTDFVMGCRRYIMKESDDTIPAARRRMQKIYYLQLGVAILIPTLLLRVFVKKEIGFRVIKFVMSILQLLQAALSRATSSFAEACSILSVSYKNIVNV